jgi:hypothetical protein
MAQMMLYADDSEKKAAYRQRQREALGELDYQHNEALRHRCLDFSPL